VGVNFGVEGDAFGGCDFIFVVTVEWMGGDE
jgi:hypothetical protein